MMPVSHGKPHAKTHGQHNKQVLRNLWHLLCEDNGCVMFNVSVMMEYVIIALIVALAQVVACIWGWKAWGWNGLFFGFFGGTFLGALVYVVGSATCAVIRRVSACFSCRHETINGYKWSYSIVEGRVKMMAFSPRSGAISIPATLGHHPVTSIEQGVFIGCRDLTGVAIPSGVTSIGDRAFYGCSGLMSVTIPNSVTSIGERAFHGCSGLADAEGFVIVRNVLYSYHGAGGSVTIPDGVASIGDSAFKNCSGLTNVTVPDSVTSIGNWAFAKCSGMTSATIPDSVTSIGYRAFHGCSGLADAEGFVIVRNILYSYHGAGGNVTIPDRVTSIEDEVFSGCSGLTSVTIPNSVTRIGDEVFFGCSGLTSVTIPDSITSIGDFAFANCTNLTSAIFNGDAPDFGYLDAFEKSCTLYVRRGAAGWGSESGYYNIQYITEE